MSRRKQTNPRAIKRDVSHDDEDNSLHSIKKFAFETSCPTETVDHSNLVNELQTPEDDEQTSTTIKCDSCQESFLTSEQFNHHRLYQCAFLPEENASDESQTSSSLDEYARQVDTIPHSTKPTEEYPHSCSYCQKSFSNMALLLKHEQIHVDLMPFRCSFCGKGFKHRRSLNRHLKLHTGERKFKCTLCESTFARSDHLKAHIRTHNNSNNNHNSNSNSNSNSNGKSTEKKNQLDFRLKIPINNKNRRVSTELKTHKDENQAEQCPLCPRICLGEDSLKFHLQSDHQQSTNIENNSKNEISVENYCFLCNAKFNSRENYLAHLRCMHKNVRTSKTDSISLITPSTSQSPERNLFELALIEKTIWCEKCKRAFDSMKTYFQHYSIQHCLQMIKCLQCQNMFESIDSFFEHIEQIHPSKTVETFKCKLCNGSFKNRSDFLSHIENSHQIFGSTNFCSLCSFKTTNNVELLEHFRFVHKIDSLEKSRQPSFNKLFSCNICSFKLNSRFELNHHILNEHDDQRQEQKTSSTSNEENCSFCELNFPSESSLFDHQKLAHRSSNSVSSTFQCNYCLTSFTSRTQLDRHSRIHIAASGTNLKCNICDRLFPTIDVLSEHKLSHCKATNSNLCSHCHQILSNENDFIRHIFEHNQQLKNNKLFNNSQDATTNTISCIICKQSLINENEVQLHAKFHLRNEHNFDSTNDFHCSNCQKSSMTNRDFLVDLSSFRFYCFHCLRKEFKSNEIPKTTKTEKICSNVGLSCPKCRENVRFDNVKVYFQHLTTNHANESPIDAFHCLKCNKKVSSREHIFQHSTSNETNFSSNHFSIENLQNSSSNRTNFCYLCRTNFETKNEIDLHLIEHQYPNRDFQCTLCKDLMFDDAQKLDQHMIQHGNKARLYSCRECDLLFMFSMHLINHQYSHQDSTILPNGTWKNNGTTKDKKQSTTINDEEDFTCKSFVSRSSTSKGNHRSVIVN